jgi:hypothetical protein
LALSQVPEIAGEKDLIFRRKSDFLLAGALATLHALKVNPRWYAEFWLRRGEVHPREHWLIRERLAPWRRRVTEAGLREMLLDEIGRAEPLPPAPPAPRTWIMPDPRTWAAALVAEAPPVPQETCDMPPGCGGAAGAGHTSLARLCAVCGAAFQAKRAEARTCSARCRKRASRRAA